MKTYGFLKMFVVILFGGAGMILSPQTSKTETSSVGFSLKDLPPIELNQCIEVQKLIGRNPSSSMPNDFVLMTKYEEKSDEGGPKGVKAFNMYMMHGILLTENLKTGIIHDMALIVKVTATDAESSRETVEEWILIDDNGDRKIDVGIFRETVKGEEKRPIDSNEMTFPDNRLQELQSYFEKAALSLDRRAEEGVSDGCMIV